MLFNIPKAQSVMPTNMIADTAADHYNYSLSLFKLMGKCQLNTMTNLIHGIQWKTFITGVKSLEKTLIQYIWLRKKSLYSIDNNDACLINNHWNDGIFI